MAPQTPNEYIGPGGLTYYHNSVSTPPSITEYETNMRLESLSGGCTWASQSVYKMAILEFDGIDQYVASSPFIPRCLEEVKVPSVMGFRSARVRTRWETESRIY